MTWWRNHLSRQRNHLNRLLIKAVIAWAKRLSLQETWRRHLPYQWFQIKKCRKSPAQQLASSQMEKRNCYSSAHFLQKKAWTWPKMKRSITNCFRPKHHTWRNILISWYHQLCNSQHRVIEQVALKRVHLSFTSSNCKSRTTNKCKTLDNSKLHNKTS